MPKVVLPETRLREAVLVSFNIQKTRNWSIVDFVKSIRVLVLRKVQTVDDLEVKVPPFSRLCFRKNIFEVMQEYFELQNLETTGGWKDETKMTIQLSHH